MLDTHDGPLELWFEADLYDQLQLVEILARRPDLEPITLRQIGEHVGRAHFGGLGEAHRRAARRDPRDHAHRRGPRARPPRLDRADRARSRTTSPSCPDSTELRFVREAFIRLAQEHPWRRDGLALSERRLLAAAPGTREELFLAASKREIRPQHGGLARAFRALERLAPLLDADDDGVLRRTALGERVLDGKATFITDRWVGGVRIDSRVLWRWDDARERLV